MIGAADLINQFYIALNAIWGYIWGAAGILWTQAKQRQKVTYMAGKYGDNWKTSAAAKGDNYYYAALYGSKWIGHMVADCSGLFVWAFKQLGGSIYHGSNTIWQRYCSSQGKLVGGVREDGQELRPGSAVFVYNAKRDNRSHIGLYVGGGLVIEASGTQAGVCTSLITDSKWSEWGELSAVAYDGADPTPAQDPDPEPTQGDTRPTLRKGSKGEYVTLLQTQLIQRGYDVGPSGADGIFGTNTEKAVRLFQQDWGLSVDGIVGKATWAQLDAAPCRVFYTVTISGLTKSQAGKIKTEYPAAIVAPED